MLALAMHAGTEPMMTKDIAEKQSLPATYLEQLMLTLRKAGLVNATRGAKGGYVLARSATDITIAEVVEALEGSIDIADCADVPSCCLDPNACALKDLFTKANQALYDVFAGVRLSELAEEQRARDASLDPMYFI